MSYRSEEYRVSETDIHFLYDLSFQNAAGELVAEQQIFDAIFERIEAAQRYILLDMFLFNSSGSMPDARFRDLAGELTAKLVNKKRQIPDLAIDLITDPINNVYGGAVSEEIHTLRQAGVNAIYTDLAKLRDSNLLYSPFWRLLVQWFGNSRQGGWLPHPFSSEAADVSVRSYLRMLNFKANHRKVFVADHGSRMTTIITSANPHNGSSAHSNVALRINGAFWKAVYTAEAAVAEFSDGQLHIPSSPTTTEAPSLPSAAAVQLLTEDEIEDELLRLLNATTSDDRPSLGAFYLSDQDVIEALVRASERGVEIRIILDPSNDAFGRDKYGIPNQPAAQELVTRSAGKIQIRWYATHGEQYHAKFTLVEQQDGIAHLLLGSANFTRRNLDNYNLEMNVRVTAGASVPVMQEVRRYYERLWTNKHGDVYTLDYTIHTNDSLAKKLFYEIAEFSGISTF